MSMPSSGLIHFYEEIQRKKSLKKDVSMPSSGLIHFYKKNKDDKNKDDLCQCPQAGLFISTDPGLDRILVIIGVNALKRAYSFLR